MTAEQIRLEQARGQKMPWKKWGPYVSERQWGTVREDYSESGDAWNYFSHDQARSRAYRWGEDGLAGYCDDRQLLCFAICLWNGRDPILKERLFGLTNSEGNHGEDVKEYYFYLDSTPTHSYMKYLYKYPQAAFPYQSLLENNRRRSRQELEYELLDTGVFEEDRYFDVLVEYGKTTPEDTLIQITVCNRGPQAAELHVLPTIWFRNVWSLRDSARPLLREATTKDVGCGIAASHPVLGERFLYCEGSPTLLFTENETNNERLFGTPNRTPYVKDGINDYIVHGHTFMVNPDKTGTKAAADYRLTLKPNESQSVRLRLTDGAPTGEASADKRLDRPFGSGFEVAMQARRREADEFYATIIPSSVDADAANVMRQALAGMMWSKQFYHYDLDRWLDEHGSGPFSEVRKASRNDHWHHMHNGDIISMPDKWEYPWYAAWDLAFHVVALTLVDLEFGKDQLMLMLRERYLHPNGQIPAYEWNFGDVNPPVHAWAVYFVYRLEKTEKGGGDIKWLKSCFQKLLLNFTWWVNRKDRSGRNVFEGGFLGLDNIGVFDRSAPLPTGGYLEQADGTAWMTLYADNMLEIAMELALTDEDYADMVLKFLQHDTLIMSSLVHLGGGASGMWDEEDGFFYDVLRTEDGRAQRLKVRSMVGLLPLCAATVVEPRVFQKFPEIGARFLEFIEARPELRTVIHDPIQVGVADRHLFAVLNDANLRRVLARMLDENEFLSPYGIRSLSRYHAEHPYIYRVGSREYRVPYLPAESDTGMFGGNSNWRGPVWLPVNALIIRTLLNYHTYYGTDFIVECPTGSGRQMNLYQVAEEIARRVTTIFLRDQTGWRPVYGQTRKFQEDPHWRDLISFYEYFHGDNGAGLGASHQTGWTGLVARAIHLFATSTEAQFLERGTIASVTELKRSPNARSESRPTIQG